jgi:hypothetical protein
MIGQFTETAGANRSAVGIVAGLGSFDFAPKGRCAQDDSKSLQYEINIGWRDLHVFRRLLGFGPL